MKSLKDTESQLNKSQVKLLDSLHHRYEGLLLIELEKSTGLAHSTVSVNLQKMENIGLVNKDKDGRYARTEKGTTILFEFFRDAYWNGTTINDEVPLAVPIGGFTVKTAQGVYAVGSGEVYARGDPPMESDSKECIDDYRKFVRSKGNKMARGTIQALQGPIAPMVFKIVTVRYCAKRVPPASADPDEHKDTKSSPHDGSGWVNHSYPLTIWEDK
jgi:DNA-binding transcriptional ArsR family regulator